jgi:uncharacterized protein (DUF934 family)
MSELPVAARIWTRAGFVGDRFGDTSGAVFFTPEEATGKLGHSPGLGPGTVSGIAHVLQLDPGDEIGGVAGRLGEIDAVFIRFPAFNDGRGFSMARLLRDKRQYKGTIRATGHVILDQIPLALRVGFSEIAVTHAPTLARLELGDTAAITLHYQPAAAAEAMSAGGAWRRKG